MNKSKALRIGGFTLAVGVTASLVGFAAHGTGAYFQGSTPGTIQGTTGHVKVASVGGATLNWTDMNPGQYTDKTVTYKTDSTQNTDIWLYFPAGDSYARFTGNSNDGVSDTRGGTGGMGRYGHFAVKNNAGTPVFSSYNLSDTATTPADTTSGCADTNGQGIGPSEASEAASPSYCGVPHYILLQQDVPSGTTAQLTMTFGVTGRQTAQDQAQPPGSVPFQIVATQTGIRPDAPNV